MASTLIDLNAFLRGKNLRQDINLVLEALAPWLEKTARIYRPEGSYRATQLGKALEGGYFGIQVVRDLKGCHFDLFLYHSDGMASLLFSGGKPMATGIRDQYVGTCHEALQSLIDWAVRVFP